MKKLTLAIALLTAAGSFIACNDKLHIAAPYKSISVVYGLLDMGDTAHYVRIQKAFMSEDQSAFDMAKEPDSSFYRALTVSIKELGPSGNVISVLPLSRVDLNNEGYPKDTGIFFNTPSYAYKFKYTLNPAYTYRLVMVNNETNDVDSAIAPVINTNESNTTFGIREWVDLNMKINFARYSNPKNSTSSYDAQIPANVGIAQVVLRFNWTDTNTITHSAINKSADYVIGERAVSKGTNSFTLDNPDVYRYLKDVLGVPGNDEFHLMRTCDMFLYVAGIEYEKYNRLNQNLGGITADEIRPSYTNIKGKDALGLFDTRAVKARLNIAIDPTTRDSIAANPDTKDLKIRFN